MKNVKDEMAPEKETADAATETREPEDVATDEKAAEELDELDDVAELDDIEFALDEVESKIAPLALAEL
ncbi:ammosamide/lymphostin RiPP family protein [Streptomyces litchfieldiae]|uniref:Ammosamide/lymphostin RiPP family protein n=1 Tax=Streptomyces litchfieldiae TaxID=3075543 RepID=A0ABU2MPY8_9ACTN|nr:ammosamide/lymphostin RiPP family protein [Streptomyces sp. DSM 44938]MDT0343615.1 ammosamide/lymphostin RiPP family protein [Streptomyces sp. DSM 44938]